jgi:uncharacterized membrane protein YuzA (DUF378 family)
METITYIILSFLGLWSVYYIAKRIKNETKKGKCAACSLSDACEKGK